MKLSLNILTYRRPDGIICAWFPQFDKTFYGATPEQGAEEVVSVALGQIPSISIDMRNEAISTTNSAIDTFVIHSVPVTMHTDQMTSMSSDSELDITNKMSMLQTYHEKGAEVLNDPSLLPCQKTYYQHLSSKQPRDLLLEAYELGKQRSALWHKAK